jgi:hypothetical protein
MAISLDLAAKEFRRHTAAWLSERTTSISHGPFTRLRATMGPAISNEADEVRGGRSG